jgi:hypothetical protein
MLAAKSRSDGGMLAAEYLHAARRDPAAEYLNCRFHASSSSDPVLGDAEPRCRPLMAAAVEMRQRATRNSSPEVEVAAALGLRVRGWPPTRTLAHYKYRAAGWKCRAPYSVDTSWPKYGAC